MNNTYYNEDYNDDDDNFNSDAVDIAVIDTTNTAAAFQSSLSSSYYSTTNDNVVMEYTSNDDHSNNKQTINPINNSNSNPNDTQADNDGNYNNNNNNNNNNNTSEYFMSVAANVIGQFVFTNNDDMFQEEEQEYAVSSSSLLLQGGSIPKQGGILPTTIKQKTRVANDTMNDDDDDKQQSIHNYQTKYSIDNPTPQQIGVALNDDEMHQVQQEEQQQHHTRDNTNNSFESSLLYADDEQNYDENGNNIIFSTTSDYDWVDDDEEHYNKVTIGQTNTCSTQQNVQENLVTTVATPTISSTIPEEYDNTVDGEYATVDASNNVNTNEGNTATMLTDVHESDEQQHLQQQSPSDNDGDIEGDDDDDYNNDNHDNYDDASSSSSSTVVTTNALRRQESIGTTGSTTTGSKSNTGSTTKLIPTSIIDYSNSYDTHQKVTNVPIDSIKSISLESPTLIDDNQIDESWEIIDSSLKIDATPEKAFQKEEEKQDYTSTGAVSFDNQLNFTFPTTASTARTNTSDLMIVPRHTSPTKVLPSSFSTTGATSTALTVFGLPTRKFVFLSDEQAVPQQLNKLQENSIRQRHEFQTRVHALECKIATMTASLAIDSIDTDSEIKSIKDDIIYKPIQHVHERISLDQTNSCIGCIRHINLEKNISLLDSQMTHSVFVQYHDAKKQTFDIVRDEIEQDCTVDVHIESIQSSKREAVTIRQYEELVSSMTRRYQEERVCRLASFRIIQDDLIKNKDCTDVSSKYQQLLNTIQQLRERIANEKIIRQQMDNQIIDHIKSRHTMMQKSILEAFSDPH